MVGAGPTGVEAATYMAEKKMEDLGRVGLCCRGDKLLPDIEGAHDKIHQHVVDTLSLNLHFNTNYRGEETLDELGYDEVVDCRGLHFKHIWDFMREDMR